MNTKKRFLGVFYCVSAAIIWGLSFVAQSVSAESVTTFTFNTSRMILGGSVLLPIIAINRRKQSKKSAAGGEKNGGAGSRKELIKGGVLCGIALFAGTTFQQEAFACGLEAGKVGFITALYMLLVPIFGLFFGKKSKLNVWVGVALGTVGLYLICMNGGSSSFGRGEIYTLLGAVGFAAQILLIDAYSLKTDGIELSCVQFYVAGILSAVCMVIFDTPSFEMIKAGMVPILYAGIMSTGVAFTFQVLGQKYIEPAVASLLLCLESAFSLVFGWIILDQRLGNVALIGCAIMLAAVMITQITLPEKKKQ